MEHTREREREMCEGLDSLKGEGVCGKSRGKKNDGGKNSLVNAEMKPLCTLIL